MIYNLKAMIIDVCVDVGAMVCGLGVAMGLPHLHGYGNHNAAGHNGDNSAGDDNSVGDNILYDDSRHDGTLHHDDNHRHDGISEQMH